MQDTPASVLGKPWLSGNPSAADLWSTCELNDGASVKQAFGAALRNSVLARALQFDAPAGAAQLDDLWHRMRQGSAGDWRPMLLRLREFGTALADADCEYRQLHEIVALVRNAITPRLVESFASEPARLLGVTTALQQCLDHGLMIIGEQYVRTRDISERRRLDALRIRSAELEAQNGRVQESSRLKNEFLANMSHELRTPLNSIIGFADMLCDGEIPAESPKHREFLANILKSGRHLLQLINDVLDLAKVEAGKFEFQPEPVDLTQLITEVAAVIRSIAASKQIRIEVDVDPAVNDVCIDPARTKQVLYNYASNALKCRTRDGACSGRRRGYVSVGSGG
jgi:signal transduction histidine kinase